MYIERNVTTNIACAIMAGGKNTRMGQHKAFLDYNGKMLINHIREHMQSWFDEVFIVTNKRSLFVGDYGQVFEDIIPNSGPLGALYSALTYAKANYVFCMACDIPNPPDSVISKLIRASQIGVYDCLVPRGVRGPEPLFAIYSKSLLKLLEEEISANLYKVSAIFRKCQTKYVDINLDREEIVNINTPEDYLRLSSQIRESSNVLVYT